MVKGTQDTDPKAFELMIDSVTDAEIIMLDPRGVVRTWNEGATRLTGYTAEEVIGKPVSFFYTQEDVKAGVVTNELEQASTSGRFEGEAWRVNKSGERFWANVVIQPMYAPGTDQLTGFVKIARDLSERREAEQQVRVWELMVESSPNAMFMVNHDGVIQRLNRQAETLFGYPRDELVGRPIEMLVPERFRSNHPGYRDGFFKDPRSRAMGAGRDLYGLTKGGVEVPIEIGLNPMETPEGTFVLASIIDISERKAADERFRLMVEAAPNAMLMVTADGSIGMVNSQTEELFGYEREALIGQQIEMLVPQRFRGHHPEFREGFFRDPRSRAMGAGRDLYGLTRDGREVPIEIGLNPIETSDGTVVLASIIDITERKAQEQQVRVWELMVESSPNAMFMVNHDGVIQRLNRQAETLFGYPREDLVGRPIEMLVPERFRPNHPGFRDGFFRDPRSRAMGAGRDLYGLTKNGVEVPIEIGLNPMETPEGTFVLASIIDISERKAADELVRRQRDEILELSTPVMQVWDKVLALPIIGTLDGVRAARLTESLLTRIAQDEATIVILDISGVPTIDSLVAQNLFKTISGARLMGAESIISGVRPETAQAMVHLGIDIGALRSRATLRDALQLALRLQAEMAFDPHVTLNGHNGAGNGIGNGGGSGSDAGAHSGSQR